MKTMILLLFFSGLIPVMVHAQNTDWFQKGIDTGDPKKQIEFFTKSIETGNDLSASYFCRASARLSVGDVQGAIDDYTKCIELDPNDAEAYYNRAAARYYHVQDKMGLLCGDSDIEKSSVIYTTNPNYTNLVYGLTLKTEDYPEAIIRYNKLLRSYPDNAYYCSQLGYCYIATGDYSLALENFNKSISLQPDKIDAYLGLTLVYYYKNDLEKTKKSLDQAKVLKPILTQGIPGFETYKKEGFICNDRDNEALKMMFSEWK